MGRPSLYKRPPLDKTVFGIWPSGTYGSAEDRPPSRLRKGDRYGGHQGRCGAAEGPRPSLYYMVSSEIAGPHLIEVSQHLWVKPIPPERCRNQHKLAYNLGVSDGELKRYTTAEGKAHDIRLLETKMRNKSGNIVCQQLEVQRPIDVGSSAMSLQIDGDDAASL